MEDNRKRDFCEQYEDLAFSILMDDYAKDEGQRLLEEFEEAQRNGSFEEMPPELDRKCRELIEESFAKQERTLWLRRVRNSLSRVAMLALVILGIAAVTVLSVDAFRIPVLNFLMDQSGKYSSMVFDANSNFETTENTANRIITRFESELPEGYTITYNTVTAEWSAVYSKNEEGHIIYLEISSVDRDINVDTEDAAYTEIEFGNYLAAFLDKDGYHLRWIDDQSDSVYTLFSNGIDINTFWEFAYIIIE